MSVAAVRMSGSERDTVAMTLLKKRVSSVTGAPPADSLASEPARRRPELLLLLLLLLPASWSAMAASRIMLSTWASDSSAGATSAAVLGTLLGVPEAGRGEGAGGASNPVRLVATEAGEAVPCCVVDVVGVRHGLRLRGGTWACKGVRTIATDV